MRATKAPANHSCRRRILAGILGLWAAVWAESPAVAGAAGDEISFSRQIRPILSENCFKCHGADEEARKAKMRLDQREGATGTAKSGGHPIVPGKPEESEVIQRITSEDEDDLMPPPATKKTLSAEQKRLLREWIAAGAKYEPHWAFVAPRRTPLPSVAQTDWPKNPIDRFILNRLEREGLRPSPPADRATLVRRVFLDLIGLPPTPAEADAFLDDPSPDAYGKLVDRLLASPQYGERWARRWLDLARYADSNGYEKDRPRSIWPYRDWVIKALNQDMPFDEFTVKQLAGDMLPHATLEDRIATGFHRNTMLNEEGGIDPLEFRYYSVVDRVATTGTAWLGLTVGCAQCHTHKFDPITHREYYQIMAFLNNGDEPEIPVPSAEIAERRAKQEAKIQELEKDLPNRFPVEEMRWSAPEAEVSTASGGNAEKMPDGSWRFGGAEKDTYVFSFTNQAALKVKTFRLEALADDSLPGKGPGRSESGNFVVSEFQAFLVAPETPDQTNKLEFARAKADFSQDGFPVKSAIASGSDKGWGIVPQTGKNHSAAFELEKPLKVGAGARWTIRIDQRYGSKHVLGRARLSLGEPIEDSRPLETRRDEALDRKFAEWEKAESEKAVKWTPLRPLEAKSNEPILTILPDDSVLASGDQTKSDTYEVRYSSPLKHVTAIRLEALPDPSLPANGPGRTYYEGTTGDFLLCEFTLEAAEKPVKFKRATQDYPPGSAASTIDGDPLTGWSIGSGEGRPHAAVYVPEQPIDSAGDLRVKMLFERYFASDLGRFRVSTTTDDQPAEARGLPAEVEMIAAKPAQKRDAADKARLFQQFLSETAELDGARREIQARRDEMAQFPTTVVMAERAADHARKTFRHNRGEYLQNKEEVFPGAPSFLPPLSPGEPPNRLGFARWLVSTNNPLTARVTVNRQWQAFFGQGLVRSLDDFGYQGTPPSHQELLDWLAVEFMSEGWSMKRLHRLIATSATYQQTSAGRPDLAEKDPENILLARSPRFRVEAEIVRDAALRSSGLLSSKMGGPSVFPPQPPGVTTEGAYRPFEWKTSTGEDRHRRSLYTFAKRTTPFAMFGVFDAPSGEVCVARREVSDTPLQALAMLNDVTIVEAARALGKSVASESGDPAEKAAVLFRRCLTRRPSPEEQRALVEFYQTQRKRLEEKQLEAGKLAGTQEGGAMEAAAWTAAARAVLNLDEAVTKE
jgi:hypothetical protein